MGNLSIWYALNVSADTNIGLWGKPDILLLLFFHSKPFVAGTNLMTLVHTAPCTTLHGVRPKRQWLSGIRPLTKGDF